MASAAVAALFAGNSAVIKVSECSLSSKDYFEKLFRKVLAARGHNPELVTLIVGEGETGAALVKSGVDKILFIGSPAVGKRVMEGASANLTPVILELGGKDPFIGNVSRPAFSQECVRNVENADEEEWLECVCVQCWRMLIWTTPRRSPCAECSSTADRTASPPSASTCTTKFCPSTPPTPNLL